MTVSVQTFVRLEEVERALSANTGAVVLGGGTILMRDVNAGDMDGATLIRTTDPALREIRNDGGRIVMGAAATMSDVVRSSELGFLSAPARSVGGPAVRNMATIAGNLFAEPPYGDFATALLALGASVHLAGTSAVAMTIDEFLRDRDRHRGRLVQAVSVERPREPGAVRWLKVSRVKPKGIAVMSMAAYLPSSGAPRVAYGNMGPTPVRAEAVERALQRATLSEQGIQEALSVATQGLSPPTDSLASEWYRREVAPVHLKRLLLGETL
ncbi:MAG: FAD binding domain-containing protein [Hyphomicrobiaceae bacterium]